MSSTKTNAEMLKSVKQYNKTARELKAHKEGFTSAARMVDYLEACIKAGSGDQTYCPTPGKSTASATRTKTTIKTKTTVTSKGTVHKPVKGVIPTIHIVDILDASGSMAGSKIAAAIKGINMGTKQLKEDTANVKYTYTLCDFSTELIFRHVKDSLDVVGTLKTSSRSSTSLFDAIGESIKKVQGVSPNDKVLVNIYTDGQENSSRLFTANAISTSISELSKIGWTFTFIGTAEDVAYAQRMLSFDKSNTLVYDGTGAGLEKSLVANTAARSNYSAKVSAGEDVSTGFYKDLE